LVNSVVDELLQRVIMGFQWMDDDALVGAARSP